MMTMVMLMMMVIMLVMIMVMMMVMMIQQFPLDQTMMIRNVLLFISKVIMQIGDLDNNGGNDGYLKDKTCRKFKQATELSRPNV